jgi:hypothetical protein
MAVAGSVWGYHKKKTRGQISGGIDSHETELAATVMLEHDHSGDTDYVALGGDEFDGGDRPLGTRHPFCSK